MESPVDAPTDRDLSGGPIRTLYLTVRRWPWYALLPAALALAMGLRGLASVGFWVDEFYTLFAIRGGLGETLAEPPYLPYYTLEWLLTGGGTCLTEACLRYPSVLAVVGAVAVAAVTARRLSNRWGGFAAGVVLALAPGIQRYAQDARPYALGLLFATAATGLVVYAIESNRRVAWVGYAVAVTGLALFLPVGLVVVLGHAVLLLQTHEGRRQGRRWALSLAATLPFMALEVVWFVQYSGARSASGDPFVIHMQNFTQALSWPVSGSTTGAVEGAYAAGLIFLALMSRQGVRWLAAGGASIVAIWLFSLGPTTWWQARSLLPISVFFVIGASITLALAGRRRMIVALALFAAITAPTFTSIRLPESRGYDYRKAVGIVASQWEQGDQIDPGTLLPWVVEWAFSHYAPHVSYTAESDEGRPHRVWRLNSSVDCVGNAAWQLGSGNDLRLCP